MKYIKTFDNIVAEADKFDPNYDKKYHYPKYGMNDYYLVN